MKNIISNVLTDCNIDYNWLGHNRCVINNTLTRVKLDKLNKLLPFDVNYSIDFESKGLIIYFDYERE